MDWLIDGLMDIIVIGSRKSKFTMTNPVGRGSMLYDLIGACMRVTRISSLQVG